jgi:hypothetical protein
MLLRRNLTYWAGFRFPSIERVHPPLTKYILVDLDEDALARL